MHQVIELAKHKIFAHAAEVLHVTQPALTKAIQKWTTPETVDIRNCVKRCLCSGRFQFKVAQG